MPKKTKNQSSSGGSVGGTTQACVQKGDLVVLAHEVGSQQTKPFAGGLDVTLNPGGKSGATSGAGLVEFKQLDPKTYTVAASLKGNLAEQYVLLGQASSRVAVPAGGLGQANFDVAPFPTLEVKVVVRKPDGTTPFVEGIEVQVGPEKKVKSAATTGLAKFEKLKPGKYKITANLTEAQTADYTLAQSLQTELQPGEVQQFVLQLEPTIPNTIHLTRLPRWFIPDLENCEIGYLLQGNGRWADKVQVEVYGSNYCELDGWNDGLPKFKPAPGVALVQRTLSSAFAKENSGHLYDDWKGDVNAASGVFKTELGKKRYANVAFSPYTVHLRYFKDDADAKARVELAPFWPQFTAAGAPVADSLKVAYKVVECTKFKTGRFVVWDKTGTIVYERDLAEGDCSAGDHSLTWDGKTKAGALIVAAAMPYRAQLQFQSKRGEAKAVAVAVSHTEVRLYAHPQTHRVDLDPYVAATDRSSLLLGIASVQPKDVPPVPADGRPWTKFALANAGFHPGPTDDANTNAHFETALNEYQRSVPKARPGGTGDYARLAITAGGNDDADTRASLQSIAAGHRRAWFGKPADRTDYDLHTDEFRDDLRDPAKELIVWVDDRHWYTDPDWLPDIAPSVRTAVTGHATALGNQRGAYTAGDARVTHDARDIPRPWLPMQVEFRLLSKRHQLDDVLTGQPDQKEISATRAAVGPLRVDWTFDEIDGDTISVPEVDTGLYHKERTRTKSALEWSLNDLKTDQYVRKDVKRKANYFNSPVTAGGVRPANGVDYFKAVFGHGATESLLPWKAVPDPTRESLVTVVHDALGQPAEQLYPRYRLGRSGVYFRPSRLAGDGYRVRAQVQFAEHADWKLPNAATLAKRYPLLPQAHSARLRTWRKSSLRGYFPWGTNNNWSTTTADLRRHYRSCHVHLANENNVADAAVELAVSDLFDPARPAELQAYRDLVKSIVANTPTNARLRLDANITLLTDRMWPWTGLDDLGIRELSPPNPASANSAVWKLYNDHGNPYWYRLTCKLGNAIADRLEKKQGRMRGHVIIEFKCAGDVYGRHYQCTACGDGFVGCEKDAATTGHSAQTCPTCSGALTTNVWWGTYQCANGHNHNFRERSAASQSKHNTPCPTCTSPLVFQNAWQAPFAWKVHTELPVPSLGDPIGLSLNFNAGHELWAHELGHNRYLEHAANAPGNNDAQHDAVANPDATVATYAAPSNRWDRACLMTYVSHLANYDAAKDKSFCCFKCVLKNRGWKLAGVNNPGGAVHDP